MGTPPATRGARTTRDPRVASQEEPAPTWRRRGAQVPGSRNRRLRRSRIAHGPPGPCRAGSSGPCERTRSRGLSSFRHRSGGGSSPCSRGEAITEPRINDRIRVPEVRLVGPEGEQVGIVPIGEALRLAQDSELDLVEVAPMARPPVVKLMDYGKFKYESAQKAREARRNQALTVIKEMRLRLKIDPHDYETKKGHVERFLKSGDKVKITVMFRGREQSRPEMGYRLLQRLAADVA